MPTTHRLHRHHTGRTESEAVAVGSRREKACSSCSEPLSPLDKPAYYCNDCDYIVCHSCDKPQSHPVHPSHNLFLISPTTAWRCNVCKGTNSQETPCYNCEQCEFYLCKKCFARINTPLHAHALYRTDVRYVYHQSQGDWACDVCQKNNGPGHYFPAHCSSCHFDACDNCIKPYKSTFHPGHVMYKADSNVTYSRFNGGWRCDRCSRSFIPQVNNVPYHCSQCEFDLCASCMRTTGEASNSVGFDEPRPASQAEPRSGESFLVDRGRLPVTELGNPVASPEDEMDTNAGRTGPPDNSAGECVICLERPKDATIVHGTTGHVCCCTVCAQELHRRRARCPICRAPIENVIRQYTV